MCRSSSRALPEQVGRVMFAFIIYTLVKAFLCQTKRLQPKGDTACSKIQDLECPQEINFIGMTGDGKNYGKKKEAQKIN